MTIDPSAELLASYQLHHVGIVSPSLDDAAHFMATLGLQEAYRGFVEQWSCWCIFTTSREGATIELVVPEGGALARFNKGVGGVHHFAFEVEDIRAASAWAEQRGLRMLEPEPIKGAGDFWCNFINPVATRGVQIEFVQPF